MKRFIGRLALVISACVGLLVGGPATAALAASGWLGPESPCAAIQIWVHASETSGPLVRVDGVHIKLPSNVPGNITYVELQQQVDDGRTWTRELNYSGAREVWAENIPSSILPWVRPWEGPTAIVWFRLNSGGYCPGQTFDIS